MQTQSPVSLVQRSSARYHADHGWLQTYHSFSFADYYDPANMGWGALRVFNDDTIAAGQGFPPHPHSDMEIITYVFRGELEHQDSMGNRGVVRDGGVQFMSAGTGVRHSEFNASLSEPLHLVQMWVIPGKAGSKPTYGQIDFTQDDRMNKWLVVASGQSTLSGAPIGLTQDATLRVSRLDGSTLEHEFAPGRFGFVFLQSGGVTINDEKLGPGDALRTYDVNKLRIEGSGELVFWDVPKI